MLIATTAFLLVVGFVAWLAGEFFGYHALTAIGSVTVIAAGAGVVLTGLEFRGGVSRDFAYQTVNNTTVVESSTADQQLQTTQVGEVFGATVLTSLGLGGLLMLLGASMMAHSFSEVY